MRLFASAAVLLGFLSSAASGDETATDAGSADESLMETERMRLEFEVRSSVLEEERGPTSGRGDNGKFFLSDGENYRLEVAGEIQFRYMATFRNGVEDSEERYTGGFQTRRTRLRFTGHVISPRLKFTVLTGFSRRGAALERLFGVETGGNLQLERYYVDYDLGRGWSIRAGQQFIPMLQEQQVGGFRQLTAERSIVNRAFTAGTSQGLQVQHRGEHVRLRAGVFDGARAQNADYNARVESDVTLAARAEVRFGEASWRQFGSGTSFRGSETGVMLGTAAMWQSYGQTGGGAPQFQNFEATVDLTVKGDGWNLFGYVVGIWSQDPIEGNPDTTNFGAVVQGGAYVTDQLELFARWEGLFYDPDTFFDAGDLHFVTFGANYYFIPESQALKLTVDTVIALDPTLPIFRRGTPGLVGSVIPATVAGILVDPDAGEVALRIQIQLMF